MGHLSQPQSLRPGSPCGRFAPPSRRPCLPRCRSSVVEHSLGKGEVDSSILSGSTRKNIDKSETFSDFRSERSTIEKSRIIQNDPATSALSDTLVAHWSTFPFCHRTRSGSVSGRTHRDKIRGCFRFRGSARRGPRAPLLLMSVRSSSPVPVPLTHVDTANCDGDLRGLA